MKRESKFLIALFVIAFLIRAVFVFSSPLKIWDETVYANLGYDLSRNFFDYSVENNGWSDYIPFGEFPYSWPNMGFRAPLLPYLLSILYILRIDFLINFLMPLIGALSVILIYFLGKKLFDEKVGLYSAIFLMVLPLHIIYSAKILTEVLFTFFVLLTFVSFWKGYEEGNKKHKILFGVFLALSLLSRYTALWIMPIFLIYFLFRDKSLKFLKDKYLWYSIIAFFLILIPWFIYGVYEYNNPLGAFIHGGKASAYWGGIQPWHFFFEHWWQMFSIVGFIFLAGLIYILYKKEFFKKEICLLLIWFVFFLGMAIYMPHKEDRFILAIAPAIVLISGYFIEKIKKHKKIILIGIMLFCLIQLNIHFLYDYRDSYTNTNKCFLEGNRFLTNQENALVITDESSIVYYYTKKATHFYPNPWSAESLKNLVEDNYEDNNVYIFFTDYDMPLHEEKNIQVKRDLENNFKKVFECFKDSGFSIVYEYG